MYYLKAIKPDMCRKIITYGLSKMVLDEKKGVSKVATTFDHKEKGAVDSAGKKVSNKIMTAGATRATMAKKGLNDKNAYVRDSEVSWLSDQWLYDLFHPFIHHANKKAGWNWQWDFSESFQFTVYHGHKNHGGFYGWHADGSSDKFAMYKPAVLIKSGNAEKGISPQFKPVLRDKNGAPIFDMKDGKQSPVPDMNASDIPLKRDGQRMASGYTDNYYMWDKVRKLSMTVNLTKPENYAGGNLKFDIGPHSGKDRYKVCKEIRPQGSIIIFPSFMYHCVTPVTRGNRYSLVLWSLGKHWQ